ADVGAAEDIPGLDSYDLPTDFNVAEFSDAWETVVVGDGVGSLAWRRLGKGVVVCVAAFELFAVTADQVTQPNADLLDWAITTAAGGHRERHDERRLPWEPSGIGGAFYPENEIEVGGVKVLYADNQLPDIVELAKTRFTEVRDLLQEMLPTPPSPGEAFYIDLAGGEGGGWAENAYTPRLAGTAATDHDAILSILGHELAHTMYGPAAIDGTAGCVLPGWFSEAHAGWFQRKLMGKLGTGPSGPHVEQYLAQHDPLLNDVDLADVPPEKYVVAWTKVWLLWAILDGRYGEDWYAKWLEYLHNKYNDPKREVSMDEYIMSISESVGEDVAPLFERFGTTVGDRTDLRPIGPPE
ncbi:MAG TPA: hypothetical protein QGH10_14025, partial [Armatimonadota bacterium]|nr:hypothetical protein [Armatimonadota bacterium]